MKTNSPIDSRGTHEFRELLASFDGDAAAYRRFFELLNRTIPHAQALLICTLPRGGTQIVQPGNVPDRLLRAYAHEAYPHDRLSWQTLIESRPVNAEQAFGGQFEKSEYFRRILEPAGMRYAAAARVVAPVLRGYPGALHVYRRAEDGDFKHDELNMLHEIAQMLGDALERYREPRRKASCGRGSIWMHSPKLRQFIFDSKGQPVSLYRAESPLDDRVSNAMRQQTHHRLAALNGDMGSSDRIELPDQHGEVWVFRAVVFREFPALGSGPYIFFCLQPESCEWVIVRPVDFQADSEMSRLVPAIKFMHQEFAQTPTLDEIAARAHLSPFHFHRRFTELFGMTPKHFLLSCQIHLAKTLLVERKTPLADIAAKCGFAHQSHFTSRFKQATGLTPTRWRRSAAELHRESHAPAMA